MEGRRGKLRVVAGVCEVKSMHGSLEQHRTKSGANLWYQRFTIRRIMLIIFSRSHLKIDLFKKFP